MDHVPATMLAIEAGSCKFAASSAARSDGGFLPCGFECNFEDMAAHTASPSKSSKAGSLDVADVAVGGNVLSEVRNAAAQQHGGFAVAFFHGLAASVRPEQRTTFCRSMADGWDAAHHQPAPTFKERLIPFIGRKATSSAAAEELTCILCLCLTTFGPGAILEENILEECIAVVQDPELFNVYCAAANMIPKHAEQLMHTDAAVSGFLTSVSEVLSALAWLENTDNLGTGSILQLSQLAAALPEMDAVM
ncbi:TPA: hypothetical protein ACH3X1_013193 [Trebouxia sp. C0004]